MTWSQSTPLRYDYCLGDPANPELVLNSYEHSAGFSGAKRKREDLLCVNPITGTKDSAAPPEANPGTLAPSADSSHIAWEATQ